MTDAHAKEFIGRLTLLAEVLGEKLSPTRIAGYRAALDDLDLTDLAAALNACATGCTFFPKPVEIRERAEAHALAALKRERLANPVVPHHRRLEAGDTPVSPERALELFRQIRAMAQNLPALDTRGRRSQR